MSKTFLFFSAQYLPTAGGVERYTYNLALQLISHGHRVVVVTSQLPGQPKQERDDHGIEIFRLPSWRLMGGRFPVLKPDRALKTIWNQKIDYCIINTYFYTMSIYGVFAAKLHKIPTIVINHGSAYLMTGNRILEWMGMFYEHCTSRLAALGCHHFYGVSEISRQWMDTFGIATEGVITNAIDPCKVQQLCDQDVCWKQELDLSDHARIIAFAGRMIPEKGVIPLVEATQIIRSRIPEAVLVLAGTGPLYEKYSVSAPEGVIPVGGQSYGRTLALFRQAEVFCLPTRSEGFACTVLEAAAIGCPVITTVTGGSPQLILDESYGTLLPDASAEAIAAACIQALENPEWRKTAAAQAQKKVRDSFTWECATQQLLEAFELE